MYSWHAYTGPMSLLSKQICLFGLWSWFMFNKKKKKKKKSRKRLVKNSSHTDVYSCFSFQLSIIFMYTLSEKKSCISWTSFCNLLLVLPFHTSILTDVSYKKCEFIFTGIDDLSSNILFFFCMPLCKYLWKTPLKSESVDWDTGKILVKSPKSECFRPVLLPAFHLLGRKLSITLSIKSPVRVFPSDDF